MPDVSKCSEMVRPDRVVDGTGWLSPVPVDGSALSHTPLTHTGRWTQSVQVVAAALPQARTIPRRWRVGSEMLYISVRVPVQVLGMLALPSSPSQVAPPSQ